MESSERGIDRHLKTARTLVCIQYAPISQSMLASPQQQQQAACLSATARDTWATTIKFSIEALESLCRPQVRTLTVETLEKYNKRTLMRKVKEKRPQCLQRVLHCNCSSYCTRRRRVTSERCWLVLSVFAGNERSKFICSFVVVVPTLLFRRCTLACDHGN